MLSETTEMYILSIYRLTERTQSATISEIAKVMNLSLSSVSERVKRLTQEGFVEHEWREGVALSEKGRQLAYGMLRKRRLIELFLVKIAGYNIDEVDEEACRLEHVISDRLADALDKLLHYPKHDPHGHPIPGANGFHKSNLSKPLSEALVGEKLKVSQIYTADIEQVKYIHKNGFKPERKCEVIEIAPFNGPVVVKVGQKKHSISREIAECIEVVPNQEK